MNEEKNNKTCDIRTGAGGTYKMKSTLMNKFFNEPVDALDSRLENAEKNLSMLPVDPFMEVKQEQEPDSINKEEHPLDYSEVQVATSDDESQPQLIPVTQNVHLGHSARLIDHANFETPEMKYREGVFPTQYSPPYHSTIQRVTLRSNSSSYPNCGMSPTQNQIHSEQGTSHQGVSNWRISPVPQKTYMNQTIPDQQDFPHTTNIIYSNHNIPPSPHRNNEYWDSKQISSPPMIPLKEDNYIDRVQHYLSSQIPENYQRNEKTFSMSPQNSSHHAINTNISPPHENERISVIDFGQNRNIPLKRFQDTTGYYQPFKKAKTHNNIDDRISLMENSATNNERLLEPSGRGKDCWDLNQKSDIQPSKSYLDRYQELIHENQPRNQPGSLDRYRTGLQGPSNQKTITSDPLPTYKQQRTNSVIVRNEAGKEDMLNPAVGQQDLFDQQKSPVSKHTIHDFNHPYMDKDWLNRLKDLRAGFAYKMLEAQQEQNYYPPLYPNPSRFPFNMPGITRINDSHTPFNIPIPPLASKKYPDNGQGSVRSPPATITSESQDHPLHEGVQKQQSSPELPSQLLPHQRLTTACHPSSSGKGKRGRPRKHPPKLPLPPLYVFIRNLLGNATYNPSVIAWVDDTDGCFKVTNTLEFAKTWGQMKSNRSEEMNYEKMSRAMRYHYGCERQGRKGHLAMVKEKRLYYRFGELAINWKPEEMIPLKTKTCSLHLLCQNSLCLWTKE